MGQVIFHRNEWLKVTVIENIQQNMAMVLRARGPAALTSKSSFREYLLYIMLYDDAEPKRWYPT